MTRPDRASATWKAPWLPHAGHPRGPFQCFFWRSAVYELVSLLFRRPPGGECPVWCPARPCTVTPSTVLAAGLYCSQFPRHLTALTIQGHIADHAEALRTRCAGQKGPWEVESTFFRCLDTH